MVDRQEVEALLQVAGECNASTIAALCRTWLAVQDAPVVEVRKASFSDGHRIEKLIGQRVRIVPEPPP